MTTTIDGARPRLLAVLETTASALFYLHHEGIRVARKDMAIHGRFLGEAQTLLSQMEHEISRNKGR